MDKYYYFVAQLPYLVRGKTPDISLAAFESEAQKWLTVSEMGQLRRARLVPETGEKAANVMVKAWLKFEVRLRRDLANFRNARKLNQDYKPNTFTPALLKDADPLQAEKNLADLRWQFLEELETGHFFDLEYLILYSLKLQLLQRIGEFNKESGIEKFKQLTETGV